MKRAALLLILLPSILWAGGETSDPLIIRDGYGGVILQRDSWIMNA